MAFCDNLRVIRKNSGYTQKELSTTLGVALSTVAMWETGNRRPGLPMAKKIAALFAISLDELIKDDAEFMSGFLTEKDMYSRITPKTRAANEDLAEIREILRQRPEVKMLFSVSKGASKADIERAVAIIEALKNKNNN